jgi:hypothetical protein
MLPIRCGQINLDEALQNFTGERASFPITNLGLPVTIGCLKVVHLQPCLGKASRKLAGWKSRLLDQGGLSELIKTVLSALPSYLLTVLKPPKKFYKDFNKIRRRFLWAGDQEIHGGKCKVNWSRVCRSLKYGGLRLTDLERFGRALRLMNLIQMEAVGKALV